MGKVCAAFHAVLAISTFVFAQNPQTAALKLDTGKEIYEAACVACHGPDGKGQPQTTVGFQKPDTFPDFTLCDQTTPEDNYAWKSIIRDGGPSRGFSQIMPAFGDALTSEPPPRAGDRKGIPGKRSGDHHQRQCPWRPRRVQ